MVDYDKQTDDFDLYLPILTITPDSDIFSLNFSSNFDSSLTSMWNKTGLLLTPHENINLHRHPILYGTAIYALLLIIVGTIGNALTIIILLRRNLRQYTTMRYLTAVATADLCSLYSWNLNLFYKHLINPYQNDLEDNSIFLCRLISFIAFVSLELSSWYLTLVSVDRCLNIHFLFWNRQLGRADRSTYIILIVTIIIISLNIHLLFLNGYQQPNCVPYAKRTCYVCYARLNDRHYIFPKWEKIHVIIYNVIPFSIMLVSNCFIIRRSLSTAKKQRSFSVDCRNTSSFRNGTNRQRKQRQLTYILLSVTFLFVFLTTPVMIYNVFLRNHIQDRKPLKYIVLGILLCIQFTSHAINFFVYCFGASKFRHELNAFFSSSTRQKQHHQLLTRTRSTLQSS
ncbi:unnamed protein product [Adineta steineri]|uniref:G-protein coupled receptors family 1 profile domain-containing protein n=1 Tax=Adineta steineri TaxID=433720 RepID=A0A814Z191_9BILA|nr:unnamed protein product [Adineta steineri]CAF1236458.1 unnamed protein product [Adineta steineri]